MKILKSIEIDKVCYQVIDQAEYRIRNKVIDPIDVRVWLGVRVKLHREVWRNIYENIRK